ncbi:MAG: hypothetical protein AB1758_10175, partial [Candidatus Eremiobacterota bacterium]
GRGGYCYRYVKRHLRQAGLGELTGGSAYMAARQLAQNPNFREVRGLSRQDLTRLPAGSVVVWDRGQGRPHGHVSVALGDGREASDRIRRQITRYPSSYRVFQPNGTPDGRPAPQTAEPTRPTGDRPFGSSNSRWSGRTYSARSTAYYPHNSRMEGGYVDRRGNRLHTLQDYLAGRAPYVSVAMDHHTGIPYGQKLRIPELEQRYGRPIEFRVVDTGGAFYHRGTGRIDICVSNRQNSLDPSVNRRLTLQFQ